jgi:hypothetical protein
MSINNNSLLKFWLIVLITLTAGLGIAFIDSQPGQDDTGITAGMMVIITCLAGYFYGKKLWLWALLAGIWIPLLSIIKSGNFDMLLVLIFPFAGSYAGGLMRKFIYKQK